jgi:hypothetical protein
VIIVAATKYGALAPLVSTVGCLVAAAGAIGLAWRGRARWEPSEEDVATGPQKVGGLVAAVAIAVLWASANNSDSDGLLVRLAISLAALAVGALLAYSFVISTQTYEVVIVPARGADPVTRKVIGGFKLTKNAKRVAADRPLTTQDILAGNQYDVDRVWTRSSLALAKVIFVACYLALTVSGTIAIASAAMLIAHTAD